MSENNDPFAIRRAREIESLGLTLDHVHSSGVVSTIHQLATPEELTAALMPFVKKLNEFYPELLRQAGIVKNAPIVQERPKRVEYLL